MHDLGGNEITEAITTGSSEPFTPNKYGTEEVERLTADNARLRSELAAYKSAEAAGLMPKPAETADEYFQDDGRERKQDE